MLETATNDLEPYSTRSGNRDRVREMYLDIPWGREYSNYKFTLFFCDRLTFHRSFYCRYLCLVFVQ